MDKAPYYGDELRIDGYYYSTPAADHRYIRVAVFYMDGFCIHTRIKPAGQDTLSCIEKEIMLNDSYIAKLKNAPDHIGVFKIFSNNIELENWEHRSTPTSYFGKIVNDTTFIVDKSINNRTGKTYHEDLTYRFKQFTPKPDSTNNHLRMILD